MACKPLSVIAAALLLFGSGCIVTTSTYEMKAREADTLRDALGSLNRDKARLAQENAALSREVASCRERQAALSAKLGELEASLRQREKGLPDAPPTLQGDTVSRERFVDELLAREKATGQRLQELSERAEQCERQLEQTRRGTAAVDR
ncbi:MAG: hypothetical protein ACM3L8_03670 [Verrucomicrobiota bacterium]